MPRPQKHVFICTQNRPAGHPRGSCGEKGCAEVANEFIQQWMKRQCFDKVAVATTSCLGPCGMGPSVLVYPEGVMYGGVSKDDVAEIFDKHLLGDEVVERLKVPRDVW